MLALIFGLLVLAPAASAADGVWDRAWGYDVIAGNAGTGFEVCLVAAQCQRAQEAPTNLKE